VGDLKSYEEFIEELVTPVCRSFGRHRDEIYREWDKEYGKDNWELMWQWNDELLNFDEAIQKYEDAYVEYFKRNPDKLKWLVQTATNVYDDYITNMRSGRDYHKQERRANHFQDIAIRRAVARLDEVFQGSRLIQVRTGVGAEGEFLSPGEVSFHEKDKIATTCDPWASERWWKPGSIEDFWQRNKRLVVKRK